MVATKKVERPHLVLELREAIKDSPAFRQDLDEHYQYFLRIQKRYDESVRLVDMIVEQGQNYVASIYNLTAALNCLWSAMECEEPLAKQTFRSISDSLGQVVHLNKGLIEHTYPALKADLQTFNEKYRNVEAARVQGPLRPAVGERHRSVGSARVDLAQRPGGAPGRGQHAVGHRQALRVHLLDYVAQINVVHARKHHVLLDALYQLYKDYVVYFKKGNTFFNDKPDETLLKAAENIAALKEKSLAVEKKMQERHNIVPKDIYEMHSGLPTDPDIAMEGHLWKRSRKTWKTWHRRYFMIKGEKFLYVKKNGDSLQSVVMEDNLKLCLVRPAPSSIERSGCFELVSRSGSHILQADSDNLCREWIHVLQRTIQHLHEDDGMPGDGRSSFLKQLEATNTRSGHNSPRSERTHSRSTGSGGSSTLPPGVPAPPSATKSGGGANWLERVKRVPGNRTCADCGNPDAKWTSLNLGIVICIECSGAHRSLGVHVSKVRSLTMDDLTNDQKNVLLELGNEKVNAVYLAGLHEINMADLPKNLTPASDRTIRERYITAKYVEKKFARPLLNRSFANTPTAHRSSSFHENLALDVSLNSNESPSIDKPTPQRTSALSNVSNRSSLTATNSENRLNELAATSVEQQTRTAIQHGDLGLLMRLMVSGLDLNARIGTAYPLHLAVECQQATVLEFLFLNNVHVNVVDHELNTPLHVAARKGHLMCVYHLIKRYADITAKNVRGERPLDLAINGQDANVVTLQDCRLRLQELRDADQNDGVENTVDSFIDDLTHNGTLPDTSHDSSA
ncbi:hypothetical protein M3Y99_00997400 [Aphelenchoides fujianensis]|nr:hypothetical protein M3Y99_00997400 [Aphelenchoides fujianensis]